MNYLVAMCIVDRRANLEKQIQALLDAESARAAKLVDRQALDVLHDQVGPSLRSASAV